MSNVPLVISKSYLYPFKASHQIDQSQSNNRRHCVTIQIESFCTKPVKCIFQAAAPTSYQSCIRLESTATKILGAGWQQFANSTYTRASLDYIEGFASQTNQSHSLIGLDLELLRPLKMPWSWDAPRTILRGPSGVISRGRLGSSRFSPIRLCG